MIPHTMHHKGFGTSYTCKLWHYHFVSSFCLVCSTFFRSLLRRKTLSQCLENDSLNSSHLLVCKDLNDNDVFGVDLKRMQHSWRRQTTLVKCSMWLFTPYSLSHRRIITKQECCYTVMGVRQNGSSHHYQLHFFLPFVLMIN